MPMQLARDNLHMPARQGNPVVINLSLTPEGGMPSQPEKPQKSLVEETRGENIGQVLAMRMGLNPLEVRKSSISIGKILGYEFACRLNG